ncbi:hypothetical protein N7454_004241 [Penicillium verhagenii]|nr:hypothetical protein N7454_004241 [Penicillium verhagenii]
MSSSTLPSQSSILGPITPNIDLTHRPYNTKPAFTGSWTTPFRDGLPTPPTDMTGIAYNAIPPVGHGGRVHGMPSTHYNYTRPFDAISSSMVAAMKPTHSAPAKEVPAPEQSQKKSSNGTANGANLQIPLSINNSKTSLAEFASQMTCLFWFEKTSKLQSIEDRQYPVPSLVAEAMPTPAFQKWVATILSTTQVSQNVILLALLFIYRLKKFNAGVKGKKGSEFRLMTVALMLGNKFLDDNTYTNKTWAEVSGIAVQEIHVMEVEFLSNIRYDLFASEAEWARWHTKLGLFGNYFDAASLQPVESEISTLQVSPPRLKPQSPLSKLPSPPSDFRPQSQPNWYMPVPGLPYPAPQLGEIAPGGSRKRSRDDEHELQPLKRICYEYASPVLTPTSAPISQGPGRLPPPNLNLTPTSNPMSQQLPSTPVSQLPMPARMPPTYNRPANWMPSHQLPSAQLPSVSSGAYNAPPLPDLARHHQSSPFGVSSSVVSPAVSAYSVHTPQNHLSPSFFLANRNSPYRPVRSVHTLLIPPPSTSMQQQRSVPFDHMHYQPLSKGSTDRKTGLLPFIPSDPWYQGQSQISQQPYYTPSQAYSA